jgi:prephenate dehydrogenase
VTAAVIGLGLIGGSIARDLAALGHRVLATDTDAHAVANARREGVVAAELSEGREGSAEGPAGAGDAGAVPVTQELAGADVVILAVPVDRAPSLLRQLGPELRAVPLVMDTGSTKAAALRAASEAGLTHNFVGAHPLTGDHRSGWAASGRDLFLRQRVYLCPADPDSRAAALAMTFWEMLGAQVEIMDAAAHDRLLAWTSHLPQLTATALGLTLAQAGHAHGSLGRGGADMTRLAGSDADMWTAIALQNRDEIALAVSRLQNRLDALRAALEAGDSEMLRTNFDAARRWHRDDGADPSS